MSETGIIPYGLSAYFCEECGRAKSYRLWPGVRTGCRTCDDVVTRHRCLDRPDIADLADGQSWECRDCGTIWTAVSREEDCPDCCGECGHMISVRRWDAVEGERLATAPRYEPTSWKPFRNLFGPYVMDRSGHSAAGSCYTMPNGSEVHVKPGCRCKK